MPTWLFILWYGTLMSIASALTSLLWTDNWTSTVTTAFTVLVLALLAKFREFENDVR